MNSDIETIRARTQSLIADPLAEARRWQVDVATRRAEEFAASQQQQFEDGPTQEDAPEEQPGVIGQGFIEKAAGAVGGTIMNMLEQLSIIDQPAIEGAMKAGAYAGMSDEEFVKRHPEMASQAARLAELRGQEQKEEDELGEERSLITSLKAGMAESQMRQMKQTVAGFEGMETAGKEAYRIASGGKKDDRVLKDFAMSVTDNPSIQKFLMKVMPFASIAPMFAAELRAAQLAKTLPASFFNQTPIGRVLDVLVPGRASSWYQGGDLSRKAIAEAIAEESRTQTALEASMKDAFGVYGFQNRPFEGLKLEDAAITKLAKGFQEGDFTSEPVRNAATAAARKIRGSEGASPEDLKLAETLESKVKEAEVNAVIDEAQPIGPRPGTDDIRQKVETLANQLEAQVTDEIRTAELTAEGIIRYNKDMTLDVVMEEGFPILQEMGYSENLIKKLVTDDDEAKLFAILHEEGHLRHADNKDRLEGIRPLSQPDMRKDREKLAMMYALKRFSELTGKPFRDASVGNLTPGSLVEYDPIMNTVALRGTDVPRSDGVPAPPEVAQYFTSAKGSQEYRAVANALATEVKVSDEAAKVGDVLWGNDIYTGVQPEEFSKIGEVFNIPRKSGETVEAYGERVYNAFVNRFGATQHQLAQGTNKYPDMTPEMKTPFHQAQVAKLEEIANTWTGIKNLALKAVGTDQEENAMNLALWYKSQIANNGKTYRLVQAHTESLNREARAAENGLPWKNNAQPEMGMGGVETESGLQLRSVYEQKSSTPDVTNSRGDVFADGSPSGAGSGRVVGEDSKEFGRTIPRNHKGQGHGPEEAASTEAPPSDAMAHIADPTDLPKGKSELTEEEYLLRPEDMSGIEYNRVMDRAAMDPQPVARGPVDPKTKAINPTPESVRLLELEEFAGVSSADPVRILEGNRINLFAVNARSLESVAHRIKDGVNGQADLARVHDTLVNEQIKGMADRIAMQGADTTEMVLLHRALGVAKALEDIRVDGKVSAAAEGWLNEMDLISKAGEGTLDQSVIGSLAEAGKQYGYAFSMWRGKQRVVDTQLGEILSGATTGKARRELVNNYADMMTGENAVKTRKQVNEAWKKLRKIVGEDCL